MDLIAASLCVATEPAWTLQKIYTAIKTGRNNFRRTGRVHNMDIREICDGVLATRR